jgi:hypothetical protein
MGNTRESIENMTTSQVGYAGSADLRGDSDMRADSDMRVYRTISCFRAIRRGDVVTCVPCGFLSCPKCRPYKRHLHTLELVDRIDDERVERVFAGVYRGNRNYIRQKIGKMGGNFAVFPQEDGGLMVVTDVALPEYDQVEIERSELEEWIFDTYMAVPIGSRVSYSVGWGRARMPLDPPIKKTSKTQPAEPAYGHKVSWDEFRAISERYNIRFERITAGLEKYKMVGLDEMGGFERMEWEIEVGSYEIGKRERYEEDW